MSKVLCLHGFLQNGKVFSEKSSGLRKLLKKNGIETDYIDGPVVLEKKDIPFELDDAKWKEITDLSINKAWFYHFDQSKNLNVEEALKTVFDHIDKNGPYDGIIGFSQGAAISTIVSNIIKKKTGKPYFKFALHISGYTFTELEDESNKDSAIVINSQFKGYFTPPVDDEDYKTKNIILYGENDNSVPGVRSVYLSNLYPDEYKSVYKHDGGHFVPNKKDFLKPIVEDIQSALK